MSNGITPQKFETLLLRLLFRDKDARGKILPFLKPEVFDKFENREIVDSILSHHEKYDKFPTIPELKLKIENKDTYTHLTEELSKDMDKEYDDRFIKNEVEYFFRDKLLYNELFVTLEAIKDGDDSVKSSAPDRTRDANSFSFDTSIGLDFFQSGEKLYDSLHEKDVVIPTGINNIDKLIKGGFHEKTLTLFMAECIHEDTKISVRIREGYTFYNFWRFKEIRISDVKELLKTYNVEVDSPDGYVKVNAYVEKGRKKLYKITVNNKSILCSKFHLVETEKKWEFAKDLQSGYDKILCDDGNYHICTMKKLNIKSNVVDIAVDHPNHRYYANGISNHNTNKGKSLVKASLATNSLLQNKNVLYITLEMSEEKVAERIMSNLFDIEMEYLDIIPKDKFIHTFEKIKTKIGQQLVIKEFPTRSANTNRIRNLLKELELKNRFIPDIIYVDYLGIMLPNRMSKQHNTNTELKVISEELRGLAMEKSIPIVSSCQTNRSGYNEVELELTDIAESIGTTNTADIMFGIVQTDEMRVAGRYMLTLLKNRYGLNKIQIMIGVDYKKMRLFEVSDDNHDTSINTCHGKPDTPKGTTTNVIVDETAVNVLKTLKGNRTAKKNKIFKGSKDIKM